MKQSTSFAQVATNQFDYLSSALCANTPPCKKHSSSRKFLTLSISLRLWLVMFLTLTVSANAWAADTWEKASSIAAGDVVLLVCESKKMELNGISTTSTKYGKGVAYTTNPAGTYKLTVEEGSTSGTYSFKCPSGQYLYWTSGNSLATNATKSANTSWKVSFNNGNATIQNAKDNTRKLQWNASDPRFACYNTNQTAVQLYKKVASKTLFSIAVSGQKTEYTVGDTFVTPTVTATYSDGSKADVTNSATFSGYNMSTAGTQTVKVSCTEGGITKTTSYTITVSEPVKHKAYFYNGTTLLNAGGTEFTEGAAVSYSGSTPTSCDGESTTFVGWATSTWEGKVAKGDITPDFYDIIDGEYLPEMGTADVNYYAVFATKGDGGGTAFDGTSGGDFKIYALVGEEKKYLKGTGSKISPVGESEATEYTFTKISDGVFSIKTGTTYLTYASNTNLGTSNSAYSWTISKGTKGSWRIASTNTPTRGIVYRAATTNQFGGYATSNIKTNGTEYYDVEIGGGSSVSYSGYITSCTKEKSVTLNPNGGTFASTPDGWIKEGDKLTKEVGGSVTLPTPTHDGCYDFAGWYDAQTDGNKIGDEYEPEEDIELFAHWTESTTSFIAMIDDENIPTVEGVAIEIGLNEDGTGKVTDGVETTCGNNVYLFRTLVQGYKEVQWTVTIDGTQETIAVQNDGDVPYFVMPKADVLVSAELIECDEMDAPVVTATSTNNSITLSWDPITGAKEYNVFIFYDYGNSHQQDGADVVIDGTNYTFTNLDAEHTYTYFVQAQTEIGTCFTEATGKIATASATCTVTYNANDGIGTLPSDETEYTNGATVTVLGNYGKLTKDGYAFTGWNTKADGSGESYKDNEKFIITANTTLYAQWCKAYWKLVTDESELENDTRIVIAAKDYNFALSTEQKTNNRGQAAITKKYNTVTFGTDVQTLTLIGLQDNKFALYTGNGYLYAASSSNNYLKTKATHDNNCYWSIGISETVASIYAQGDNTHDQIKYNHQQNGQLFSCYESSNTSMSAVVIYKEVCVQDQYNVTSNLTNATAKTNPTTVAADATSLTINYSANTGYLLPETITVKMGGVELASGTDYTWNKETGVLTITVTGFYGDIYVKIVAEEDPCYQFAMSEVTANFTTNSITLSWSEVNGATGYNVKIGTGEFTAANGLTHTFEGLSPKTPYTWEVQAVKEGEGFHCEASKTGSTTTQKETFTVSWSVNGNVTSTESVVDGEKIKNYPSDPSAPSGCNKKVFVGWTKNPINTPTDEAPAPLYKQMSDVPAIIETMTLHAVWADKNEVPGEKEPATEKIISKDCGYNSGAEVESVTSGVVSIAFNKGTNNNVPKYYSTGEAIRTYGGNYFTIASDNTITSVELTFASGEGTNAITTDVGTYSEGTWTGSANSVKFTVSGSSGHRRISQFAVTYLVDGEEVITYSAYTTLCDECTPSESLVLSANASTADLDINGKATIAFSTTGGNGGEITYAASPKTGVTWDNGTATFTKAGKYTITASQEKNGENCPTTSNTVNVTITAIPHLYFVTDPAPITIEFDPVECGGNTRLEDKKSVSVQAYNLAAAVTAQVTGPYKIARTSGATLNEYTTSLTLRNNITDGKINGDDDVIYILSFPPAGSGNATEGTLTFTTTNGNTLTVNLSTPTITCTPRTLTFNDRGIKTTQEYYAGNEVPEPATPTGVCGEYEFDGWALAKVESGSTTYAKVEFPYIMPANNQTVLYAVYRYTEGPTNQYELVTEIESGKDYVIAAYDEPNGDFALTNSESSTNGKFTSVKVECDVNNIITTDNADIIWTVTGNDEDGYKFYNSAVKKYIEMYRSDGKSLLRLVDNCTNTFDVNIEMDENDKVYVDITSPEIDETYKVFSFYEQLFNVYKSCDYNIYFYEQTATPFYTITPDCHPSVTLISDGEVYVTATNGRGIMAATPLTLTTTDLAPNTEIAISSNSNDIYFSTERNTNFAMAQVSQPKTSLTLTTNEGGELETQLYIHYKPSADGDGTPAEVIVTADVSTHNPPFTAQKTIHVRNLPAKFVIATKAGATWYALPANMNGATNPAAVVIEVDETTMTATAPNTTPYTLWPVATINGGTDRYKEYGERLRFAAVNNGNRGLWANDAKSGTTINNDAAIIAANSTAGAAYEWKITTTIVDGNWQYTLQTYQSNNQNYLRYWTAASGGAKWGTYASGNDELYFLPVTTYTDLDLEVMEWGTNSMVIRAGEDLPQNVNITINGTTTPKTLQNINGSDLYKIDDVTLTSDDCGTIIIDNGSNARKIIRKPLLVSGNKSGSGYTTSPGRDICAECDIVILNGGKLIADEAQSTGSHVDFANIYVYPGGKLVLDGKSLGVKRQVYLRGGYSWINQTTYALPEVYVNGVINFNGSDNIIYDYYIQNYKYYQFSLPYQVPLAKVTDEAGVDNFPVWVKHYNGALRAANANATSWEWYSGENFEAGIGYIIAAKPRQKGKVANRPLSIIRFPLGNSVISSAEADKSIATTAHGIDAYNTGTITANNVGWNFIGNPFMATWKGDIGHQQLMKSPDAEHWNGSYHWENNDVKYITVMSPEDGTDYGQYIAANTELKPFFPFYLQETADGGAGTINFAAANRIQKAPAELYADEPREAFVQVEILTDRVEDQTGVFISDTYSDDIDFDDYEKIFGSSLEKSKLWFMHEDKRMAFEAMTEASAAANIALGYRAPRLGKYTFAINEDVSALNEVVGVYLTDHELGVTDYNLLYNTYEFETEATNYNDQRFTIRIALRDDSNGVVTGVDNIGTINDGIYKFIYQDKMYIYNEGIIYDATGKQVTNINK